ncbi:hypothetical protein [Oceanicaulis sp.]|jgi:hypothetical protein|uniref:hypothetical protein n=1 Tax=Oceanicaulis sp. TaxID=1924941 RepID=UPI000D477671
MKLLIIASVAVSVMGVDGMQIESPQGYSVTITDPEPGSVPVECDLSIEVNSDTGSGSIMLDCSHGQGFGVGRNVGLVSKNSSGAYEVSLQDDYYSICESWPDVDVGESIENPCWLPTNGAHVSATRTR